jgi:hypothetical protein
MDADSGPTTSSSYAPPRGPREFLLRGTAARQLHNTKQADAPTSTTALWILPEPDADGLVPMDLSVSSSSLLEVRSRRSKVTAMLQHARPRNPKFKQVVDGSMLSIDRRHRREPMKMSFFRLADHGRCSNNPAGSSGSAGCAAPVARSPMVRRCTNSALDTMAVET